MKALITLILLSFMFSVHSVEGIDPTDPPKEEASIFSNLANRTWALMQQAGLIEDQEQLSEDFVEQQREAALRMMDQATSIAYGLNGLRQSGPVCRATPRISPSASANESVLGARLLLATLYQSCEAPNITVSNDTRDYNSPVSGNPRSLINSGRVSSYIDFNPYLDQSNPRPGCFDINSRPPIYGYGAKPSVGGGTINLHRDQSSRSLCGGSGRSGVRCSSRPVSAIDCSGFITGALRRMGLNMRPNQKFNPSMINTSGLNRETARSGSCLEFAEISPQFSIGAGDIINIGGNHVVMVDEVGEDPLGIMRHVRNNSCRSLTVDDFDFKFLHSGALGNLGPAKADVQHPEIRNFMSRLAVQAMVACNEFKNGSSSTVLAGSSGADISVIRHKGDKVDGCKGETEEFANESCVSQCGIL